MCGSLTVRPGDFRIWLCDIGSKFTDVQCRKATIAPSRLVYTPVYYPCCQSSNLVWNSFIGLRSYGTCYFDPYFAVACRRAIRTLKGFRRQRLLTKLGSMWQIMWARCITTHSVRDRRVAVRECICCPTAEERRQPCPIPPIAYAIVGRSGGNGP